MSRFFVILGGAFCILASSALSGPLNLGNRNNLAGEWCCGIADCGLMDANAIHFGKEGYRLYGQVRYFKEISHSTGDKNGPFDHSEWVNETIPYSQALPSPDGAYWRCKRPDGTPRCFFAPPPGS